MLKFKQYGPSREPCTSGMATRCSAWGILRCCSLNSERAEQLCWWWFKCHAVLHSVGWWTDAGYIRNGVTPPEEGSKIHRKICIIFTSQHRRHIIRKNLNTQSMPILMRIENYRLWSRQVLTVVFLTKSSRCVLILYIHFIIYISVNTII